ncbi:M48 family metalloprotease [Litorimonas haliclonae]|uniref:M48 family metalloprotease n=1 Tax=Litorimonas haliclonae TaxID=2081977 RepID=UPI0039EF9B67
MLNPARLLAVPALSALLLAPLSGCAGLDTRLPSIAAADLKAEKQAQEKLALTEWDEMAGRLIRVGRPILLANQGLCPKTGPNIGVFTHEEENYEKRLRGGARRELGVGEDTEIFHIAPDSPAAKIGLKRGDIIRNADGDDLDMRDIQKALEDKKRLTLDRGEDKLPLRVTPDMACAYRLRLKQSSDVNAYADGRNITVTTGMMTFVENDEELALIVGHELAHNTMGHIRKIIGNFILSGFATRYTRPFESEADYVGLYYSRRAGYGVDGVEDFWRRLAKTEPRHVGRAKTHPTFPDRYLRLAAARAEIKAKEEAGEPLVPNFKTSDSKSGNAS